MIENKTKLQKAFTNLGLDDSQSLFIISVLIGGVIATLILLTGITLLYRLYPIPN